jgi:hypothetical protein
MMIDTSYAVEIEASPVKLLGIAAGGSALTALSAALAFHAFGIQPGSFAEFAGYVGTLFFGVCTFVALQRVFTTNGPVVTITREGIRDSRVAAELIQWSAVRDITTWKHRDAQFIVLAVDPAVESALHLTRVARWSRSANRALGADGLCLGADDLKIGFDELLATTVAFARASQSREAAAKMGIAI